MCLGLHARDDPHQHVLGGSGSDRGLEAVDIVGVVHDDQTEAVLHGQRDLLVQLRVAVEHHCCGVDAGAERTQDLAAARHVEAEPLLHHHPLHGRAGEGLRGKDHPAARPAVGQPVGVLAGSAAQGLLGHDLDRSAGALGDGVEAAPTHHRHPVGVEPGAGGHQVEQRAHGTTTTGTGE